MTTHKSGQIRIFSNFINQEDKITDVREHWHSRDQIVMDAQFSLDGNMIVSGGQEAVLVNTLWKAKDEQKHSFLPRLEGPIIWILSQGSTTSIFCKDVFYNLPQVIGHLYQWQRIVFK